MSPAVEDAHRLNVIDRSSSWVEIVVDAIVVGREGIRDKIIVVIANGLDEDRGSIHTIVGIRHYYGILLVELECSRWIGTVGAAEVSGRCPNPCCYIAAVGKGYRYGDADGGIDVGGSFYGWQGIDGDGSRGSIAAAECDGCYQANLVSSALDRKSVV